MENPLWIIRTSIYRGFLSQPCLMRLEWNCVVRVRDCTFRTLHFYLVAHPTWEVGDNPSHNLTNLTYYIVITTGIILKPQARLLGWATKYLSNALSIEDAHFPIYLMTREYLYCCGFPMHVGFTNLFVLNHEFTHVCWSCDIVCSSCFAACSMCVYIYMYIIIYVFKVFNVLYI